MLTYMKPRIVYYAGLLNVTVFAGRRRLETVTGWIRNQAFEAVLIDA